MPADWDNRYAIWKKAAAEAFEPAEQRLSEGHRGFEMAEQAIREAKQMRELLDLH